MFGEINRRFNKAKKNEEENRFIIESTLEVEEVLPGSEDEFDDEVDVDSVPEDVYKEIDKKLDELISKGDYDDEEIEEMVDEDDDLDDDDFDIKVEEVIDEAVNRWIMNEDPSYGSGENVDIQNKTGDEKDGNHVDTEIPEPDCPVKANKDMEHGEDLYDFSDDNKKPSAYKEGDHVTTTDADFETTEEAKKAMHESAIGSLRAMLEDASFGSGESVDVQNKTNDYQEGDHVKTEEPDFETTAEAKKDLEKDEAEYDKYREGSDGSDAGIGMKEGDHAEMETKNPITNESAIASLRAMGGALIFESTEQADRKQRELEDRIEAAEAVLRNYRSKLNANKDDKMASGVLKDRIEKTEKHLAQAKEDLKTLKERRAYWNE